ncbi:hypothetical protein NQ317_002916 [Molorchus minor]|uniref:Peptidase A2 domain-containing protein n=1 Tax=Molorchus minor TaxID=1323400 RepID=A0ABQ9JKQ1_9CUCU|nr:hypothetical protein NQ317_002916 [Molorchus minor]
MYASIFNYFLGSEHDRGTKKRTFPKGKGVLPLFKGWTLRYKRCHSKQKCILCGKSHAILMCLELPAHKEERDKEGKQVKQSDQVLTNHTSTRTLRVHLIGKRSTRQVRALLDTGSQRSYILQNTAQEMGFVSTKEEKIIHTLFGGRITNEQRHICYEVSVSGAGHTCSLEALDQPMICNPVPYIQEGPWTDELKALGIAPTDVIGDGPIEMLFGADVIGKLYTGRKQELTCGLFAVETLLGWTPPKRENSVNHF